MKTLEAAKKAALARGGRLELDDGTVFNAAGDRVEQPKAAPVKVAITKPEGPGPEAALVVAARDASAASARAANAAREAVIAEGRRVAQEARAAQAASVAAAQKALANMEAAAKKLVGDALDGALRSMREHVQAEAASLKQIVEAANVDRLPQPMTFKVERNAHGTLRGMTIRMGSGDVFHVVPQLNRHSRRVEGGIITPVREG